MELVREKKKFVFQSQFIEKGFKKAENFKHNVVLLTVSIYTKKKLKQVFQSHFTE